MVDVTALAHVSRGVLYGLMARYGEQALSADYEFAWQKENALLEAVARALRGAAKGWDAPPAAKPRWLDGVVARELRSMAASSFAGGRFMPVRLMERLGLVDLEPDDTYVLAMVAGLGDGKPAKLRADPELVDRALWRVFEVEGGGEVSLTNVDRFGGDEWRRAFLALTADGTLSRGRVLDECLRTLGRDFAAYRASWFSSTFLALEPTLEELDARQPALRALLSAALPVTVGFALKHLITLERAGRLNVAETLHALPPATLVKPKGTVLDALRLAKAMGAEHPGAVLQVARTAMGHPHADVQRAAAALLAAGGADDEVAAVADDLSPSVRRDLGLALAASVVGEVPRRSQPLAPVPEPVSEADLAERTAALLEGASDAAELEAVLAALARPGSETALAPLRKRAAAVLARGTQPGWHDTSLACQIARLVLNLRGEKVSLAWPEGSAAQRFVVRRLAELRDASGPLLATPDLPGGWVSPAVLLDRLAVGEPRHHDLVAALLRLHPDGRGAVPQGVHPAVRFAYEGAEPVGRRFRIGRTGRTGPEAWWVAAARSRGPWDAAEAPTLRGVLDTHSWQEGGRLREWRYVKFDVAQGAGEGPDDEPTTLSQQLMWQHGGGWTATLAALWPHDAEHFLALTCAEVLWAPSSTDGGGSIGLVLDLLARHPGRLGVLAAHVLAAGLTATGRDHRLHGVDAFLDLVPTGRIAVADVAEPMAAYAEAWPANRWAESLATVAADPAGGGCVIEMLTLLLPRLPVDHRGLNRLLDLLRDETLRRGGRINDPDLIAWLGRFGGSSAASKAARSLLG